MIIVACVLKVGKFQNRSHTIEYTPAHVQWLAKQVKEHLTIPHRFVCLSDVEVPGVKTLPLINDWKGWWSKIELFRSGLFYDKVFYIDLDTVITGNINELVEYPHTFTTLRQFSQGEEFMNMGSGIMSWNPLLVPELSNVYDTFKLNADKYMEEYTTSDKWGDQKFIQHNFPYQPEFFQLLFPNKIVSFITDLKQGNPTEENKIVCFHGKPKPEDIERPWIPVLNYMV